MTEKNKKADFETSLSRLEKVVAELENGDLSLEKQLKAFENGVSLSRVCLKELDAVEKKVEKLMADGTTEPFPIEDN